MLESEISLVSIWTGKLGGHMKSYDYAHCQGVKAISWEEFAILTVQIVAALAAQQKDAV